MSVKDLLRIADLGREDVIHLLDLAELCRAHPAHYRDVLRGDTVVTYFAKPSTRTRLSFGTAISRLGGTPEVVRPDELQLGRGETIEDTARVISRYARAFVIRTFSDDDVARFASAASIPVINALTDRHHPCQALADLLTLRQHFGQLDGLKLAYVGDGNNVVHSLLEACALVGVDIAVASPSGFTPAPDVCDMAHKLAAESGAVVTVTDDPYAAVVGADAVYTDVWLSMGDPEEERQHRARALAPFQVNQDLMGWASPHAVFLHCLPAHRGDEVTAEIIDGPQSLVFDQAENRQHTAEALLLALLRRELHGA